MSSAEEGIGQLILLNKLIDSALEERTSDYKKKIEFVTHVLKETLTAIEILLEGLQDGLAKIEGRTEISAEPKLELSKKRKSSWPYDQEHRIYVDKISLGSMKPTCLPNIFFIVYDNAPRIASYHGVRGYCILKWLTNRQEALDALDKAEGYAAKTDVLKRYGDTIHITAVDQKTNRTRAFSVNELLKETRL